MHRLIPALVHTLKIPSGASYALRHVESGDLIQPEETFASAGVSEDDTVSLIQKRVTTEEDTAAEQEQTLTTTAPPLRPVHEELSITNEDILRTFLQRHWAKLLIISAIAVLAPVLIYMGYQLMAGLFQEPEPPPQIPLKAEHWGGNYSQIYDPKMQGIYLRINGEQINERLEMLIDDADNTRICAYNSQYAKYANNHTGFLLGLKAEGEQGPPSVYLPAENSSVSDKGGVCFVHDLSILPSGRWRGAIYTIEANYVAGEDDSVAQIVQALSQQEPSFEIELYEDSREN